MMTLLIHWLWQGALVAAAAALTLRVLRRLDGATRHAILWVAVGTVVALPLAWPEASVGPSASPASAAPPDGGVVLPELPGWIVGAVICAWVGWVALAAARIGVGWHRLRRLGDEAEPLPPRLLADVADWPPPASLRPSPEVRVSRDVRGACAIGFGRPTILVSADLVRTLDPDALAQVLLHEHAHLERGDHWDRLAQSIVEAIAGLHPAVAFLLWRLELEREVACDEHVVLRTRAPRRYARSLVDAAAVEARGRAARVPAVVPGATRSRSGLRARVERLIGGPAAVPSAVRRAALAASLLAAVLSLGAAAAVAPAVVFTDALVERPHAARAALAAPDIAAVQVLAPVGPAPEEETIGEETIGVGTNFRRGDSGLRFPGIRPDPNFAARRGDSGLRPPEIRPDPNFGIAAAVVLESRTVSPAVSTLAPIPGTTAATPAALAGTWSRAGSAARVVGKTADRAGAAIGEAAARGGAEIGQGTTRAGASLAAFFGKAF